MASNNERDKYPYLTDEEWARRERLEEVTSVALDELQLGDRLGIVAEWGEGERRHREAFLLEVSDKEQLDKDGQRKTKVTFRYFPNFIDFTFFSEQGEILPLTGGMTLKSGFSSASSRADPDHSPYHPDYNHIKTGESYWFENSGGTGQRAIARRVSGISLLRNVNI